MFYKMLPIWSSQTLEFEVYVSGREGGEGPHLKFGSVVVGWSFLLLLALFVFSTRVSGGIMVRGSRCCSALVGNFVGFRVPGCRMHLRNEGRTPHILT